MSVTTQEKAPRKSRAKAKSAEAPPATDADFAPQTASSLSRRSVLANGNAAKVQAGMAVRFYQGGGGGYSATVLQVGPNGAIKIDAGSVQQVVNHKSVVDQLPADDVERRVGYWDFIS